MKKEGDKVDRTSVRTVLISWTFLVLALPGLSFAQVSSTYPEEPRWGETLIVTYDPGGAGAKFSSSDDVYVVMFLDFPRETKRVWAQMDRFRDLFRYEMKIEEGLGYAQFYFITLSDWDMLASAETPIYSRDGKPARGANQNMMHSRVQGQEYRDLCEKELSLYPDNLEVYRDKWFLAKYAEPESLVVMIKKDMTDLTGRQHADSLGLLYSLSYGYLLLGQEEKAREVLRKMVRMYPSSLLTGYATDSYEYEALSGGWKGEGPEEVAKMKLDFIASNPKTDFARRECSSLVWREGSSMEVVEKICRPWIEDENDNPMPYLCLATEYDNEGVKLKEASGFIEEAINLLHQSRLRFYEDISGRMTEWMLPSAYLVMAKLSLKQREYARAVGAVQAAQALEKEADPEPYLVEAGIWRALSKQAEEESAYTQAWRRGSEEARDSLKALYGARSGGTDGFDEYLRKSVAEEDGEKAAAPSFKVTCLDGDELTLDSLRGKVVVLNFWYMGCGPCRMEMPSLNRLVAEFKGQDVEFIGISMDDEKSLRKFLENTDFNYRIVPAGRTVADHYAVQAYPTHVVIDQNGKVDTRLTGASEDIDKKLGTMIRRLLGT
jgi:peroxiredoxin/tetratricopeptide (TPR) repeat protein